AFDITAGTGTQLVFTVQPATTTAGAPINSAVEVTARDAMGNTATGFTGNVTVAIGTNPNGGALSGTTTVAAVAGVATFSTLSIDKSGTGYTLTAGATEFSGATSTGFAITPGPATQLAFTVQPSNTTAGATITPAVQVTARDAQGNTATGFTGNVTVAIGANPGGSTRSPAVQAAVAGVATFSALSIEKVGTGYTITAVATGLAGTTSTTFDITPGAATQLVFTVQPATTTAGVTINSAVEVTVHDALGNTATGFTGNVTVAIGTNPNGGTLAGTTTLAAAAGIATFSTLSIDKVGTGYTLTGAATGLGGATSTSFEITPGAAALLVFTVQPTSTTAGASITPAVQVTARDAQGNTATGFTGNVTVAIGTNPGGGTLSGTTTVAASAGVASFANLSINKSGTGYTLTAAATGFAGLTSTTFDITPGAPTQLFFTVLPSSATAGASMTPAVQVTARDGLGNTATGFAGNVTVAIGANPGGGTLSGTTT
ncbi:MAG: beta strand repeat-containing protein, partial [Acidimicrobiales bacterium]